MLMYVHYQTYKNFRILFVIQELGNFLAGDTTVVYMSLGSIAKSNLMPVHHKKTIVQTFSKLPYKLLWKFEDDSLGELPGNIMIRSWMPQQDILGSYHCQNLKTLVSNN